MVIKHHPPLTHGIGSLKLRSPYPQHTAFRPSYAASLYVICHPPMQPVCILPQFNNLTITHPHPPSSCDCITSNRFFCTQSRSHYCINAPHLKSDSSTHDGWLYTFQYTLSCLCTLPQLVFRPDRNPVFSLLRTHLLPDRPPSCPLIIKLRQNPLDQIRSLSFVTMVDPRIL